jgi:hypothetical protein
MAAIGKRRILEKGLTPAEAKAAYMRVKCIYRK